MAARVLSRGPSVVLSAFRGPTWRLSASRPASRNALAGVSSRRHNSQLSAGVQDGETPGSVPGSVSKEKDKTAAEDSESHYMMKFDDRLRQGLVKEAVDVSGGTAAYKVLYSDASVSFYQQDGLPASKIRVNMPHTWLRDNCRCPKCVNQETMQRSFNILTTPLPTPPPLEVQVEERGVKIMWTHERHESFYEWAFIKRYLKSHSRPRRPRERDLWGAEIKKNPPTVTYSEVMGSEEGVAKMTSLIMRLGLVFVEGTPFDDSIHTKKLLERIGPIRETHYGGFYDFIPDMAKADTAYTNIALAAHTDTTYFTDPAGLQAFHLLSHTPAPGEPDATGGESLLVDGFHAAQILKASDRSSFKELVRTGLPWHASGNEGVTITPDKTLPVFELGANMTLLKVRWNADDRGVVPLWTTNDSTAKWYEAAAKWEQILRSKELEYWYQLKPGTTVIFDNHRVLHGRSAFTGLRRICGGYISMDDFVSRWRNTNLPREEVLVQVIG